MRKGTFACFKLSCILVPSGSLQLWQEAYGKEHTLGILKVFDKPPCMPE